MEKQLSLDVQLRDFRTFDNFVIGENQEAVGKIREMAIGTGAEVLFLWGPSGSGKTHLLQAICRVASDHQFQPVYIPLADASSLSPEILAGISDSAFVCIDDVDIIAGRDEWERALFTLFEEVRGHTPLIVTAKSSPRSSGLIMQDLLTRLASGLVYQMQLLSDQNKIAAMQLRAAQRGFDLTNEVANYVLNRYPRDTHVLFGLLDELDKASLATQRRITIPFIQKMEATR
ncbi:MAG: DnaA regulatory inactivator Hda [Acidiferrobacterales bacterium]